MTVTWWQFARNAVLLVLCGALLLVPPVVEIVGSHDLVTCRPLGVELRAPVSLGSGLTDSQSDAIDRYLERYPSSDRERTAARLVAACQDARQDRQTLIVVVGFVLTGWLVTRRRSGSRASGTPAGESTVTVTGGGASVH